MPGQVLPTVPAVLPVPRTDRVIVFAWVNDEGTKRVYGNIDDAYRVFSRMLGSGHPPSDWDPLLVEVHAGSARFARFVSSSGA